jgi:hypothetical protein
MTFCALSPDGSTTGRTEDPLHSTGRVSERLPAPKDASISVARAVVASPQLSITSATEVRMTRRRRPHFFLQKRRSVFMSSKKIFTAIRRLLPEKISNLGCLYLFSDEYSRRSSKRAACGRMGKKVETSTDTPWGLHTFSKSIY